MTKLSSEHTLSGALSPFVQSIVSLTSSLRGQLNSLSFLGLYKQIYQYFLLKKHFFNKNNGVFEILTFEILTKR